jgi:hypothetical protein
MSVGLIILIILVLMLLGAIPSWPYRRYRIGVGDRVDSGLAWQDLAYAVDPRLVI